VIDRVGRGVARVGGLALIATSTAGLAFAESVIPIAAMLFLLGVGWNVSFVAATTQLADLAAPWERGRLLGFHDFAAAFSGATFVLLGGSVLAGFGVTALAFGASVVALVPTALMLFNARPRAAAPHTAPAQDA
jgi:MFS family permease